MHGCSTIHAPDRPDVETGTEDRGHTKCRREWPGAANLQSARGRPGQLLGEQESRPVEGPRKIRGPRERDTGRKGFGGRIQCYRAELRYRPKTRRMAECRGRATLQDHRISRVW